MSGSRLHFPKKLARQERRTFWLDKFAQVHKRRAEGLSLSQISKQRQISTASDFALWLTQAEESKLRPLLSFINGIRRDFEAVQAAFQLPWHNGLLEGHVNRLRFGKRQMFGRWSPCLTVQVVVGKNCLTCQRYNPLKVVYIPK